MPTSENYIPLSWSHEQRVAYDLVQAMAMVRTRGSKAPNGVAFTANMVAREAALRVGEGHTPAEAVSVFAGVIADDTFGSWCWAERANARLADLARRRRAQASPKD